jgi:hypothetical protein
MRSDRDLRAIHGVNVSLLESECEESSRTSALKAPYQPWATPWVLASDNKRRPDGAHGIWRTPLPARQTEPNEFYLCDSMSAAFRPFGVDRN